MHYWGAHRAPRCCPCPCSEVFLHARRARREVGAPPARGRSRGEGINGVGRYGCASLRGNGRMVLVILASNIVREGIGVT
jgi:hypothetical protein